MKVSVIIPVYNVEKYLKKCLDSLINQTYSNLEIIVVNDGSTDNSSKIIKEYVKKYKNIINIDIDNHGQGYARNLGLKKATGDYIMFLDSDDYLDLTIIEKLINNIKDSDLAVCNLYKVINGQNELFVNYHDFGNNQISLMLSHPGPVAKLYKKEILKNVKFLENVYYEDLSFTPVVALNTNKVSYVNEELYYYIIHDNSTMNQKKYNSKMDDIFKVIDYLKDKLKNYQEEFNYLCIEHLLYSAVLRYVDYPNCQDQLEKINTIIKDINWKKNKYYKMKSYKFKLICNLDYKRHYKLIKFLKKVSGNK